MNLRFLSSILYTSRFIFIINLGLVCLLLLLNACSIATYAHLSPNPPTITNQDLNLLSPEHLYLPPSATSTVKYTPEPSTKEIPVSAINPLTPTPTDIIDLMMNTPNSADLQRSPTANNNETSDLLYLLENALYRWDHITGYTGLLVDNVSDYFVSQDGKKIFLLRPHKISANGISIYDLDMLDLIDKQLYSIKTDIPKWEHISLSPDGSWLTYHTIEKKQAFSILNLQQPDQIITIDACNPTEEKYCSQTVWAPNSKELIWSDSDGVRYLNISSQQTHKLIQPDIISMTDPKGNENQIKVRFEDLNWSPQGRYVLTRIVHNDSEIGWYAILDTAGSRLVRVPDTYHSDRETTSVRWSQAGNLLVAQTQPDENTPIQIKHWFLLATHDYLLVSQVDISISSEELDSFIDTRTNIEWLSQLEQPYYFLSYSPIKSIRSAVIYTLNLEENLAIPLFNLGQNCHQVLWAPDNSGFLIYGSREQIQFFQIIDGNILSIQSTLGMQAKDFHWLPPAPRN